MSGVLRRTVNKLNLDSEDGVHTQLTRINHRVFRPTQIEREGRREEKKGVYEFHGHSGSWKSREESQLSFSLSYFGSTGFILTTYYLTSESFLTIE